LLKDRIDIIGSLFKVGFKPFGGIYYINFIFFPKVFWDFQFWTFFLSIFQKSEKVLAKN
jgi:hypothetical protein